METSIKYENLAERRLKMREAEAQGMRMVSDTFDPGWTGQKAQNGKMVYDEPHGTMVFTDQPEEQVKPAPAGMDLINQRIAALESRIAAIENKTPIKDIS